MNLRLKFPPTPEFANQHADVAVSSVESVENIALDYSPYSLETIDRIIQQFRDDGLTEDDVAETVFSFGCYAGEVFVRNLNAVWADPMDCMPPEVAEHFSFMVVRLPNGRVWSPISKAFRELENGGGDSLAFMFRTSLAGS